MGLGNLRVVELRVAVASCELSLRVASCSCELQLRVVAASCSCELPKQENENFGTG